MNYISLIEALFLKQSRDVSYAVWIAVLPVFLYAGLHLFFPALGVSGSLLSTLSLLLAGTAGFLNEPLLYAQMREDKMIRRLQVTPLGIRAPLAAVVVSTWLFSILAQLLLVLCAFAFGDIPYTGIPAFYGAACMVTATLAVAGAWIPSVFREFLAVKNTGNILFMVMLLFAGIFFKLPASMAILHRIDPLYWIGRGLLSVFTSSGMPVYLFIVIRFLG